MAKVKKHKEQEHHNELLENPDALADQLSRTEVYVEENKGVVLGIGLVLLLIVAGYFGWNAYQDSQNEKAQNEMFQAVYYFESDSLDVALNGDGINLGFKDIIDEYGMTDAANLANFYAGATFLKKGDYKSALLYLEDFEADDLLVQARAYSLMGDAHMELGDFESAAGAYNKAASYKENKFFSPQYLMKAGLAYEKANNTEAAIESYDKIINEYWDSSEVQDAKKFRSRLDKSNS